MGERVGFDWGRRDMAREERLCRRAELAFGEALGPALGAPVVARARASLRLDDADVAPTVDWNAAFAAKQRSDQAAVEAHRSRHAGA
jgi:hypothetical protein